VIWFNYTIFATKEITSMHGEVKVGWTTLREGVGRNASSHFFCLSIDFHKKNWLISKIIAIFAAD
jgi:hypothetical protein